MKFIAVITAIFFLSCSQGNNSKADQSFETSKVLMSFKSVADMNDSYFVIKENNFVEFYRQLFDSVKNSSYVGTYSKNGDTMLLNFYDKKGNELLGNKAVVDKVNNKIVFFK